MSNNSAFKLAVVLLALSVCAMLTQASHDEQFPGNYPAFEGPVEVSYEFSNGSVTLDVPAKLNGLRTFVYAYDRQGVMFGILKPIANGRITVNRGDYADVKIATSGRQVTGYELLKRMDHYLRQVDMFELLQQAQDNGLRHGVQRCLYPMCTRCLEGCKSVISGGDIPLQMEVAPGGQIHPVYARGKCPRCGKCFAWCPVGVITDSRPGRSR